MAAKRGTQKTKYTPDYVVFDLETTGISRVYDEVVEISAVKVRGGKVVDEFSTLVNPGRHIPSGASQVNGITDQMVAYAPRFVKVLQEFLDFTEGYPLVGHNIASFDMKFICRDAEKYYGSVPVNDYVDTLPLARKHLPNLSHHKLTDLASYYGLTTDGAHRALNDCRMNQQVYECMVKEMREARTGKSASSENNAPERNPAVPEKPKHSTMKLRGVVERITYQNPENGYTVLKCAVKNYNDLVTVIGNLLDVNVGSVLLIDGNWKVDSKYGRQFVAESW